MRHMVVLLAALVLAAPAQAYTRLPMFEDVASEIAGRRVEVRCAHTGEYAPQDPNWIAYTWWNDWNAPPNYVVLSPNVCWSLILLAVDPDNQTGAGTLTNYNAKAVWDQGQAVLVLAHEAVHMTGIRDEGVTECRALSHTETVLERFGVDSRRESLRQAVAAAHENAPATYKAVC